MGKLVIDDLMFEVTRRCNMKCQHCLRGGAQRVDMPTAVIKAALVGVSQLGTVSFTGGEPMLRPNIITAIFDEIHRRKIELHSFWMATNGKIFDDAFVLRLIRAYAKCMDLCGEFYGGVSVSHGDGFHY